MSDTTTERPPAEMRAKQRLDAELAALEAAGVDLERLRQALTVWGLAIFVGESIDGWLPDVQASA